MEIDLHIVSNRGTPRKVQKFATLGASCTPPVQTTGKRILFRQKMRPTLREEKIHFRYVIKLQHFAPGADARANEKSREIALAGFPITQCFVSRCREEAIRR
jgi:hypothetical protein